MQQHKLQSEDDEIQQFEQQILREVGLDLPEDEKLSENCRTGVRGQFKQPKTIEDEFGLGDFDNHVISLSPQKE